MRLFELDQRDAEFGYYNPNADHVHGKQLGQTRAPKLTLRALNRLKKMRALKKMENMQRQDLLQAMYGQPEGEQGGGMGGMGF
jgi:hypothetical protein